MTVWVKLVGLCALVCLGAGQLAVAAPLTNLNNRHNMSSDATHGGRRALPASSGGTDQICIFCHTPHAAAPGTKLSSRPDPATSSFPLYAQPLAIKGNVPGFEDPTAPSRSKYTTTDPTVTYPNGATRLCLSCHDGVTAIGILRDSTTIAMVGGENYVPATAAIDLSTSHPISFVYDTAVLADVLAARGANTYQLPDPGDTIDTPLDGLSRMQCTTCHDPHEDASIEDGTLPPFWRETGTTAYDDVCDACHIAPPIGAQPLHDLP
jgi:hypothetical protein